MKKKGEPKIVHIKEDGHYQYDSDGRPILKLEDGGSMTAFGLCPGCGCMTYTIKGKCGKCGAEKKGEGSKNG